MAFDAARLRIARLHGRFAFKRGRSLPFYYSLDCCCKLDVCGDSLLCPGRAREKKNENARRAGPNVRRHCV
ncbi:hypothetical protein ATN79_26320 [Paraburkholderia caribensis]|nr:hypothetical protein ATN79_26320 [Paraburkholderia caribensis]